jgi:hypothetical protein
MWMAPLWPVVFIAGWVYHLVLPLLRPYLPVSKFSYDGVRTQVNVKYVQQCCSCSLIVGSAAHFLLYAALIASVAI